MLISGQSLQRKRSEQRNDSANRYRDAVDDDDDDDDDDDVVIGSSSSLNSNDRFEQAYLTKYKTGSSQNVRRSQMTRIQEEERSIGKFCFIFLVTCFVSFTVEILEHFTVAA